MNKLQFTQISELPNNLEIDWVVNDFIERNTLGLIIAPPGTGKTFLSLDIGLSIATGRAWHGHEVKNGTVIMIAGEGHSGLKRRAKAWETEYGAIEGVAFYVSSCAVQLFNEASAIQVNHEVNLITKKQQLKPELIIIDTLARNYGGGENNNDDMSKFICHIDKYLKDAFKCAVLIVHHTGHSNQTRARGASCLFGAMDFEYSLVPDAEEFTLVCNKMKDASKPEDTRFRLKKIQFTEDVSSCVVELTESAITKKSSRPVRGKNQGIALSVLKDMYQEQRKIRIDGGYEPDSARVSTDDWKAKLKFPHRQTFSDTKKALIEKNLIKIEHSYVYLV